MRILALLILALLMAFPAFPADNPSVVRLADDARGANGSGVILTPDGWIVTAFHCVSDPDRVRVKLADGRIFQGRGIAYDRENDLALVKIDAQGLIPARIGLVRKGAPVVVVGYVERYQVELAGMVEALDGKSPGVIDGVVTTAPTRKGMSGGGMFSDGLLVGVNVRYWEGVPLGGRLGVAAAADKVLALFRRSMK